MEASFPLCCGGVRDCLFFPAEAGFRWGNQQQLPPVTYESACPYKCLQAPSGLYQARISGLSPAKAGLCGHFVTAFVGQSWVICPYWENMRDLLSAVCDPS